MRPTLAQLTMAPRLTQSLLLVGLSIVFCAHPAAAVSRSFAWHLPAGYPTPKVPADNPMSIEKVELGRLLFYDTRLSGNGTQSCSSCHVQEFAFTDGLAHAVGSTNMIHPRSSMSLTNTAYSSVLTWGNPTVLTLEQQVLLPMFGTTPIVELGLKDREQELFDRLRANARYQRMFAEAYPDQSDPVSLASVVHSLTSFVRTLISGNSPYERYINGLDDNAVGISEVRGADLFFSERLECFHCHGGFAFTDSVTFEGKVFDEISFQNNGLYNIDGHGAYPPDNTGIFEITRVPEDMGSFKAPTLLNIALTQPYMHDGSIATLDGVLDHYAAGGRTITDGPYAGDGSKNPFKSGFIRGFQLTDQERTDVLNFLISLTDKEFVTNPRISDPIHTAFLPGDCDRNGSVSIDEIVAGIAVAGANATLAICMVADVNGDGDVKGDELLQMVNSALGRSALRQPQGTAEEQ